jgi:hypothetical protein
MSSRPRRPGCRAVAFLASFVTVAILVLLALHDWKLGGRLVVENGIVENLQVILMGTAGVLAARQGLKAKRRGEPFVFEVAVVAAMTMICIGEVDLDRLLFGTKVIHTRFFVSPKHPLGWRLLAVLVVVGAPTALGIWLLVHIRELCWACLRGLLEPWGQVATFGIGLYVLVQVFEHRIDRLPWQPPYFFEEVLELVGAIYMFVGLAARQRAVDP